MNYELAKELKDAGFPQDCQFYWCDFNVDGGPGIEHKSAIPGDIENVILCAAPTLSELIEAVKALRLKITINGFENHWNAFCSVTESASGTTCQEAVARLWLAVHNSKSA